MLYSFSVSVFLYLPSSLILLSFVIIYRTVPNNVYKRYANKRLYIYLSLSVAYLSYTQPLVKPISWLFQTWLALAIFNIFCQRFFKNSTKVFSLYCNFPCTSELTLCCSPAFQLVLFPQLLGFASRGVFFKFL